MITLDLGIVYNSHTIVDGTVLPNAQHSNSSFLFVL
jgi:hypothetical protein